MKRVIVYDLPTKTVTVEADFIEFHTHQGYSGRAGDWQRTDVEKFVKHSAPVVRVNDHGEDYYIAVHPSTLARIGMAAAPQLQGRIRELEGELEKARRAHSAAARMSEQMRIRAEEWREEARGLHAAIKLSGFWTRFKYLFTRRLK